MLNKIISFSLHNRVFVMVVAVLLLFAGTYVMQTSEVDVFPDLNAPTVVIMTEAKGMAPEEVERLVTFPVETAVNGATDVRRVRSSSTTGFSIVWVEFDWGTDIYKARQIVSEKLSVVGESLPANAGKPTLGPQSSILGEVMIIGLTADSTSQQQLRTAADWTIRPRLLSTGGVSQVAVLGGDIKEYQILLDPDRMRHFGVGLGEVIAATEAMNDNASGGVIYQYGNEYIVRGVTSTSNTEQLGSTVVCIDNDYPVTLADIAKVEVGSKSPRLGMASVEGKPAVLLTVTKQPATSTIDLTNRIDRTVEELKEQLPADVVVSTDIFRQSRFIDSSIDNIRRSLIEGAIFVVIILFVFLMNVRTTLISLVTMPLALLISIIVLRLMGLSLNTMSIGGLAIAIGSLVDDAIVDVENVYKRLRENRTLPKESRKSVIDVVYNASREVRLPILNSTFIIVVCFVPLFFLTGMEGRMLRPLGIAFIVALFASTLVALTLTPVLCSYLPERKKRGEEREPIVGRWLKKVYRVALGWSLSHKKVVLGITGLFLAVAVAITFTLGRSFLPSFNEGSFTINVTALPGISLEESDRLGRDVERLLLTVPEIETVARKTGRAELDEHSFGVNTSEIEAPFRLGKRSKESVTAEIREKLSTIAGINVEIGQPISHRIDAMLSGTRANIAIKLFGSDLNTMYTTGNQIKEAISDLEGLADINVEQQIDRPELKIEPRREMMARYGITPSQLNECVEVMLGGRKVSQVYEGNRSFDLTVKADDRSRNTIDQIKAMTIDAADGTKIPLSYVADIVSSSGPNAINRENVARKIVVSANVTNGDLVGAVNAIKERVGERVVLPKDYHIEYGGQAESEQRASRTLLIASLFSIVVIFMLLFNQFRSGRQAAVVLLNLPLALIGGIVTIFFTGRIISIPSLIGFISLFGIATRNGMLLIDRYNEMRSEGTGLKESIMRGSIDRLNPIIMTALTSALALIPLAVGGSLPGNEIQSPMAKVLLGGLLSSTLLNGFVIPIMYELINRKTEKAK